MKGFPALVPFVSLNPHQELSIDFADPEAVKCLNRALLKQLYGISHWDIPDGYLCPPVPGRADYLHSIADLLSGCNGGTIPRGEAIRALDIGVGANCIYPIIGHREYGWSFVGTDVDPVALASARTIARSNPELSGAIELRLQPMPSKILKGLLQAGEIFDFTICNPPFHASLAEANEGSRRKWRNLGLGAAAGKGRDRPPVLNFGGQGAELWCPGGEVAFVRRMIQDSAEVADRVLWFSSLVSKGSSLPAVHGALEKAGAVEVRTIDMAQGQKKSRIVAWTFLAPRLREAWVSERWRPGKSEVKGRK